MLGIPNKYFTLLLPFALLSLSYSQTWDFTSDLEGWIGNSCNLHWDPGQMNVNIFEVDPQVVQKNINVDASKYKILKFRLYSDTSTNLFEVFFRVNGSSMQSGPNTLLDRGWAEYEFDLSHTPAWSGNITELRLDPTKRDSGFIAFDWIRLEEIVEPSPPILTVSTTSLTVGESITITAEINGIGAGRNVAFFIQNGSTPVASHLAVTDLNGSAEWTTNATSNWTPSVSIRARDEVNGKESNWQTVDVTAQTGFGAVSSGISISPIPVLLNTNFNLQFTLRETQGYAITFDSVAVAILENNDSLLFDLAIYENVVLSAGDSRDFNAVGAIYNNPPGTYKAKIRGKVAGGDWFPFETTGVGSNPVPFQVNSAPSEFTLISPASGVTISNDSISFKWNEYPNAVEYELIVDNNSGTGSPEIAPWTRKDLNNFTDTLYAANFIDWLPRNQYHWYVKAYLLDGSVVSSETQSFLYEPPHRSEPEWYPFYRAYKNADRDHFFCTIESQQTQAISQGYKAERAQGFISRVPFSGSGSSTWDTTYIYRLYWGNEQLATNSRHLYTIDGDERDTKMGQGWTYEGITGFAFKEKKCGLFPLYHLQLNTTSANGDSINDNLYTISARERDYAVQNYGYEDKGIICYVWPSEGDITIPWLTSHPSVGYGINPINGNFSHMETAGFSIPAGRMSLDFSHMYSSKAAALGTADNSLGFGGWTHNYSASLTYDDCSVIVYWPGGGYHVFEKATGKCITPGVYSTVATEQDTFKVATKNQIVFSFSKVSFDDRAFVLTSIKDRNNNTIALSYDSTTNNLIRINGPFGRSLSISYYADSLEHCIRRVFDPVGRSIFYGYDSSGRLSWFRNAEGDTTHYAYKDSAKFQGLLETVTYPEGNTITNSYDPITNKIIDQRISSSNTRLRLDYNIDDFTRILDNNDNRLFDYYYDIGSAGRITKMVTPHRKDSLVYGDTRHILLPTQIIDSKNNVKNISYDDMGNMPNPVNLTG